jgi:hypothetical protein
MSFNPHKLMVDITCMLGEIGNINMNYKRWDSSVCKLYNGTPGVWFSDKAFSLFHDVQADKKQTPWLSVRKRNIPTDWESGGWSAKLVPTFAGRGCRVVSVTAPYGR